MKTRTLMSSDIARHPNLSWSPRDYIFTVGETVIFAEEEHVVVRQDENDLWLSRVEYVPGSRVIFACDVPQGPSTTIFAVKRPKGKR
jgi:hypothetical protein